ncbi:hypothetical protein BV349_05007 [Pseudomonas syringae pv. actinidiae]|nr:hypothetical protein BV349_05007 [Pseudomonas syringae pv. actinidiae]OSN71347.1 hypothetical protein BV351_04959 [Pseudomonas syringae pv. actinidiae]
MKSWEIIAKVYLEFLHTLGPVQLARRPASHPPDQRQGSAVTYVALCVASDIAIEKRFRLWAVTMRTACRCVAALIIYQYLRSAVMQCTNLTDYRADAPRRHAVLDALRHTAVRRFQVDLHKTQLTLSPFGALLRWQQLRTRLEIVLHGKFVTQSVTNCMPTRSIGTIVVNMSTTRLLHIGTTVG